MVLWSLKRKPPSHTQYTIIFQAFLNLKAHFRKQHHKEQSSWNFVKECNNLIALPKQNICNSSVQSTPQ